MKNNVNRKNINVDKKNVIPLWNFKQEDDTILKLALYKGAIPFDITGQTIVLGAKRPNNTVVEQTDGFTISGNEIDIVLKNNILAINGLVELDLQITDVNGKLTTASFFITVFKKVLGENNLEASNDISAINQLVADLQAKTEEVNNAISTIEPKADKLMNDIKSDYNSLQKIIIDENQSANLQGQITDLGSQLDTIILEVTPRMTNDNLQEAVDLAVTLGVNKLKLEKKTYNLSDTLYLPSNFTLDGVQGGSIISMQGVDKPVISKKGSINSNTHIKNITIIGDKTQSNNDGIYFNDYYSSIENCTIRNCGRHGVYFANGNTSGTLVENKFKTLVFRDCMGYAFYSEEGNKCTDATLEDILVNGTSGVLGGIKIGSGAGWFISKVHTYNFYDVCPFDIRNAYNTNIDNIYIENSGPTAIGLYQVQQSCNINNITIMRNTNMTTGIQVNKSTSTNFTAIVNINNYTVVNNIDNDFTMINSDASNVAVNTTNITPQGNYKSRVKLVGDNIKNSASYINTIQIDGVLKGTDSTLYLNGVKFSPYITKKWSGSGEKSIVVSLNNLISYSKIPFLISLFSQKWDTQGGKVKYVASGLISCGNSITSNAVTSLELGTSVGLSNKPTYSINTETLELTITFTPSATDGSDQGVLFIQFGY